MQPARFAALVRVVRRRSRLRQVDVAARAGVCQQTVSRIERAELDSLPWRSIRAVADSLGIVAEIDAHWHGPAAERLLDAGHASLVDRVVARLRELGWEVQVEYSFNRFGERGAVDVLAWRAADRSLLIVEDKTRLVDVQETLATLGRKARVVPQVVASERGWRHETLGVVLVLPRTSTSYAAVIRHRATFDAALPARTVEIQSWLAAATTALRGVWFFQLIHVTATNEGPAGVSRVRRRKTAT